MQITVNVSIIFLLKGVSLNKYYQALHFIVRNTYIFRIEFKWLGSIIVSNQVLKTWHFKSLELTPNYILPNAIPVQRN